MRVDVHPLGPVTKASTQAMVASTKYLFSVWSRNMDANSTATCFIDSRVAFVSLDCKGLCNIVFECGVSARLIHVLKLNYSGTKTCVAAYPEKFSPFERKHGVPQRCPLFSLLYNLVVDRFMHCAMDGFQGVQLSREFCITDLRFADDVVVIAENPIILKRPLNGLTNMHRRLVLRSISKT